MAIDTLDKTIDCLTLQKANLGTYQAEVGATAQDILDVTQQLAMLGYIRDYADLIDTNKKTVFQIKNAIYNGDEDEAVAPFPVFPAGASPFPPVAGILSLTKKRNRRFENASGYNNEIVVALGIIDATPSAPTNPSTVKPGLEAFAAQTGNLYTIVISNRADSDMWELHTSPKAVTNWAFAASGTGKSPDITAPPSTPPGEPYQLQCRIQLKKNNQNYGQLSDIVYVTVNP